MSELLGLLSERDRALRAKARSFIEDLRSDMASFGAAREDLETLRQAAQDLEALFMLVVVGEFNSGKSALINTLLGSDLLEEGVTPTTASINILRHGESAASRWLSEDVIERDLPVPLLRDAAIVDTPGTNAILLRHQELTEQFIPRSDLVLFVTSVDRPFTESERRFMETIRGWGKKLILVINKTDLLRTEEELRQVLDFVDESVQSLLGFRPEIFPLSVRRAREMEADDSPAESRAQGSAGERQFSPDPQFSRLQRFIVDTLNSEDRVKLKLSSPLGVALRIAEKYESAAAARLSLLAEDARAGESIEAQLGYYREDLQANFASRVYHVENIVYDLDQRADKFFDQTFRLARVFDLINSDKIRGDFEREVLSNTSQRIDESVDSTANWMVDREVQVWQTVTDELARRRQARAGETIPGESGSNFEASRRELIQNVTRSARSALSSFDREAEARTLGDTMREAVAQTALVEVGALGLGTVVTLAVGTAAADVTGILAGTVLAGLGLYIIPARKARAQKKFHERTEELRVRLKESLSRQLDAELESSLGRLREATSPYMRFVRSEQEKVEGFHGRLFRLREQMGALRREIGAPGFEG